MIEHTVARRESARCRYCGGSNLRWPTFAPSSLAIDASTAIRSWTGNRYRDLAISDDRRTFYIATEASGETRALDGSATQRLQDRGAILGFRLRY